MCGLAGLWRPTAAPADELEAHSLAMADASPIAAQWSRQHQIGQRLSRDPLRRQLLPAQAPSPLLVLRQGFDTAAQAIPRRLHLVSDPHHFPRAQWAAQIATGGLGTDVLPLPVAVGAAFPGIASPVADWPSLGLPQGGVWT